MSLSYAVTVQGVKSVLPTTNIETADELPERADHRGLREHPGAHRGDRAEHRQGPRAVADRHRLDAGDHGARQHVHGDAADRWLMKEQRSRATPLGEPSAAH